MGHIYTLNNGQNVAVNSMEDIIDVVSENLSSDLGRALHNDLDEYVMDVAEQKDCLKDELNNYQWQNEEYHDCILDNANDIEQLISDISDWKTITENRKTEIINRLNRIHNNLWAEV